VADVTLHGDGAAAQRADGLHHVVRSLGMLRAGVCGGAIVDQHIGALARAGQRGGPANAARRAGNDDGFVLQ
jgi:hypothetical protein